MLQNREQLAREAVRKMIKNAGKLFIRESSRLFYSSRMKKRADIQTLVALAREGDKEATEILRETAVAVAGCEDAIIPRCFHEFVWEWFMYGPPKTPSGLGPKDTGLKHQTIATIVKIVIEDYGLPEYRNSEELSNPEAPMTACQIVAEETGMSESWVIKIWQDRKEMFTRVGGTHSPVE
jgi:hypothetical protein